MIAIGWLVMARRVRNMVFMFRDREYTTVAVRLATLADRLSALVDPKKHPALSGLRHHPAHGAEHPRHHQSRVYPVLSGHRSGHRDSVSGLILSKVRGFFLDYPYLLVFPASIVSIISISFYIMGNAFSDAADPRNHV